MSDKKNDVQNANLWLKNVNMTDAKKQLVKKKSF